MKNTLTAFIIGAALGDGNLSNPNKRAIRLRITCDNAYPRVTTEIATALQKLFPKNKVSTYFRKDNCTDISVYSNALSTYIPWEVGAGTKFEQSARVPDWIFQNHNTMSACLRGLILTDGSIYSDRGYLMINFCTNIQPLAEDTRKLATKPTYNTTINICNQPSGKPKYTIRFCKEVEKIIRDLQLEIKLPENRIKKQS